MTTSADQQLFRVRIELFGVPRLRAGVEAVEVQAFDVASALRALAARCPSLSPSVVDGGALSAAYVAAINGTQFDDDPGRSLREGDVIVILSAQAGG